MTVISFPRSVRRPGDAQHPEDVDGEKAQEQLLETCRLAFVEASIALIKALDGLVIQLDSVDSIVFNIDDMKVREKLLLSQTALLAEIGSVRVKLFKL